MNFLHKKFNDLDYQITKDESYKISDLFYSFWFKLTEKEIVPVIDIVKKYWVIKWVYRKPSIFSNNEDVVYDFNITLYKGKLRFYMSYNVYYLWDVTPNYDIKTFNFDIVPWLTLRELFGDDIPDSFWSFIEFCLDEDNNQVTSLLGESSDKVTSIITIN